MSEQLSAGVVQFTVDLKVTIEEMRSWSPTRVAAFFGGIEQAMRAKLGTQNDIDPNTPLDKLGFSLRARNKLLRLGVTTIGGLTNMTIDDLKSTNGIGPTARYEIMKNLQSRGLELRS